MLKELLALLISLSGVCVPGGIASARAEARSDSLGVVYAYGWTLSAPYRFTGIGGDTLYLNGRPFAPKQTANTASLEQLWETIPEPRRSELMKRSRENYAFEHQAFDSVKAMHDAGASYDSCLEEYARIYRTHPHVISVTKGLHSISLEYDNGECAEGYLSFEKPARIDLVQLHEQIMQRFWSTIEAGGMVAFGAGELGSYELYTPRCQLEKTLGLLTKLKRGEALSEKDIRDTPLSNAAFLADVKLHLEQPNLREE